MFCPQCHAEYRPGFTRCADCDVELVEDLPAGEEAGTNDVRVGTLVPLWEGDDLALHTSLLEELEAAGIRYHDRAMSIYPGVRRWDIFPVQPMTRFGYQVAVLSSDLASAKQIVKKLTDEKPHDMELQAQDEKQGETPENAGLLEEAATCEIWSGSGEKLGEFLASALKENGIVARLEKQVENAKICVPLQDETRAREIVREIVEGAPPG
jgi:hypothetical protein